MMLDKKKMIDFLAKGIRFDGRKPDEFRKMKIEYGIAETAEGSARVTMGDTVVIAGVKMEVGAPYPDTPDKGGLMVGAELLAMSSPDFESGPPSEWAVEVARVVDRGIRESHSIDVHKLVIKKGESVWNVLADICIINDGGCNGHHFYGSGFDNRTGYQKSKRCKGQQGQRTSFTLKLS